MFEVRERLDRKKRRGWRGYSKSKASELRMLLGKEDYLLGMRREISMESFDEPGEQFRLNLVDREGRELS